MHDAFTIEILKDKLHAAADEMAVVLARTSMSPIVYEVLDFACGITDRRGQAVAQANGLTLFTGTFGPQVEATIRKFGLESMQAGDVYMTNNPYEGGTHTCDVCLIRPVFYEDGLVAFAVAITHWIEIGGKVPGSISPDSTEIYQEGLQLPCIRLYHGGELNQAVLDIIRANVRLPLVAAGDVNASVAATAIGELRLLEASERYGVDTLGHDLRRDPRPRRAGRPGRAARIPERDLRRRRRDRRRRADRRPYTDPGRGDGCGRLARGRLHGYRPSDERPDQLQRGSALLGVQDSRPGHHKPGSA